jgi:hypothetical protein
MLAIKGHDPNLNGLEPGWTRSGNPMAGSGEIERPTVVTESMVQQGGDFLQLAAWG